MIRKTGRNYKEYAKKEIEDAKYSRDFVKPLKEYMSRKDTRRGILVTGLRSTGKSTGVYQATIDFLSDKIYFISPTSREDSLSKAQVLDDIRQENYDLIFIDEYSWLKNFSDGEDRLAGYLAGKAKEGVKVIITGTDSTKIHGLLNTEFIHRAIQLNTTYFSYDEYCRLYELDKNDSSMKKYLTKGGIFENHACESFGSMGNYIKTAIIENLASYYPQYGKDVIEAAVYKIFYECICKNYTKNADKVPIYSDGRSIAYADYLENFGVKIDVEIRPQILNEIFNELNEIGVVDVLSDIQLSGRRRAYITNQTISAQMTKCIYDLNELPERYLGDLFEASVVCHEYNQYISDINSPYEMYYAEDRKSSYEIDFVLCDKRKAYLFECKLNNNDNMRLNDTASILKDEIKNKLGDRDLAGRYVIYQGKDKYQRINDCDIVYTNNWDIDFESFDKYVNKLKTPLSREENILGNRILKATKSAAEYNKAHGYAESTNRSESVVNKDDETMISSYDRKCSGVVERNKIENSCNT